MLQISGFTSQLLLLVGIIRNIGPEHPLRPSSIEFQWLRPIQLLAKNCNSRPRSLLPAIFNGKIFDATWNILCFSSQLQSVLIIQTTSHKSLIRSNPRCSVSSSYKQLSCSAEFQGCQVVVKVTISIIIGLHTCYSWTWATVCMLSRWLKLLKYEDILKFNQHPNHKCYFLLEKQSVRNIFTQFWNFPESTINLPNQYYFSTPRLINNPIIIIHKSVFFPRSLILGIFTLDLIFDTKLTRHKIENLLLEK